MTGKKGRNERDNTWDQRMGRKEKRKCRKTLALG